MSTYLRYKNTVFAMFLISGMELTVASENKLTTTVADTNGRCLLENTWIDVSGRYIHWEISGPRVALRWHKSDLILPKVKNVKVPDDSPRLRVPIAFAINLTEGSPRLNKPRSKSKCNNFQKEIVHEKNLPTSAT